MKLQALKRPASEKYDQLDFVRDDGSRCQIDMPRQGVLAHDLVHYVIESGLGLNNGFLSLVARGADARFVMEMTHDPRNQDVERGALQAEALVEAMQTQLWHGEFDFDAFWYGVEMAAQSRAIAAPVPPSAEAALALYARAVDLHQQWLGLRPHEQMELRFDPGAHG